MLTPFAHTKHELQQRLRALVAKPRTQYQQNRLVAALDSLKDEEVTSEEIVQIGTLGARIIEPEPPECGKALRISWT